MYTKSETALTKETKAGMKYCPDGASINLKFFCIWSQHTLVKQIRMSCIPMQEGNNHHFLHSQFILQQTHLNFHKRHNCHNHFILPSRSYKLYVNYLEGFALSSPFTAVHPDLANIINKVWYISPRANDFFTVFLWWLNFISGGSGVFTLSR